MAKRVLQKIEMPVVGINHRVTPSTQLLMERRVETGPLPVILEREPDNYHDENAIKVILDAPPGKGMHIGYVPRGVAAVMAKPIDDGQISDIKAHITDFQPEHGTATAFVQFKTPVKVKVKTRDSKVKWSS